MISEMIELLEPKGEPVCVRLFYSTEDHIQDLIQKTGLNRSDVINLLLKIAIKSESLQV